MDSDFFETRQRFLELCVGNHYQFDQMRRAKHSSMMVLWHLTHPTAPAFVHSCNKCGVNIESGMRWACDKCPEYDLCDTCHASYPHNHQMKGHPVHGAGDDSDEEDLNSSREKMCVCGRGPAGAGACAVVRGRVVPFAPLLLTLAAAVCWLRRVVAQATTAALNRHVPAVAGARIIVQLPERLHVGQLPQNEGV